MSKGLFKIVTRLFFVITNNRYIIILQFDIAILHCISFTLFSSKTIILFLCSVVLPVLLVCVCVLMWIHKASVSGAEIHHTFLSVNNTHTGKESQRRTHQAVYLLCDIPSATRSLLQAEWARRGHSNSFLFLLLVCKQYVHRGDQTNYLVRYQFLINHILQATQTT